MSTQHTKQAVYNPRANSTMKAQEVENFESFISSTSEEGDFESKGNDVTGYFSTSNEQLPYNTEGESLW
jgi:hypothetical protein